MATNPDLDPKLKLMAVYNNDVRIPGGKPPLDADDFNYGIPSPYSGGLHPDANTMIKLVPKPQVGAYGTITLYYNRVNFATLTGFSVEKGSATTVLGLLDEINEELGVELTPLDVQEAALGSGSSFVLTATDECLIFFGSTTIGLT